MVTEFLGPTYPRRDSVGATLNALRTRLETDKAMFDGKRDTLCWQVREAIRTEFFKIRYPAPPSAALLNLVTRTEILLTAYHTPDRPFFFPGARVAVPTEAGSRRAGTTLQLRFKPVNNTTVTEALLHLDGPNGGGFQWVQTPALTPLLPYPAAGTTAAAPRPRPAAKLSASTARAQAASTIRAHVASAARRPVAARAAPVSTGARGYATASSRPYTSTAKGSASVARADAMASTSSAPSTFVPEALLSMSPPPRKRLRHDVNIPTSLVTGSLRRISSVDHGGSGTRDYSGRQWADAVDSMRGVERLVARRKNQDANCVEYYVKWSGTAFSACSWESRDALMTDVPGMVVDFDVRHPREPIVVRGVPRVASEFERVIRDGESKDNEGAGLHDGISGIRANTTGSSKTDKKVILDDATRLAIPEWLDSPILELGFAGMSLHIRRSNEWCLFNDSASMQRDLKKRRTRFKQENPETAQRLFPLTKAEAKTALDVSMRAHKAANRHPILFPRGIGQVAYADVGHVPYKQDVLDAPASWESYLMNVGLECVDWSRDLLPHMPGASAEVHEEVEKSVNRLGKDRLNVHRERAIQLIRDAWRPGNGERPPPFVPSSAKKHDELAAEKSAPSLKTEKQTEVSNLGASADPAPSKSMPNGITDEKGGSSNTGSGAREAKNDGFDATVPRATSAEKPDGDAPTKELKYKGYEGFLRARNSDFAEALERAQASAESATGDLQNNRWYDTVWGCWRDKTHAS